MEVGLNELVLAIANLVQLVALLFIQRRTRQVRQELADVLEWVREPPGPARPAQRP